MLELSPALAEYRDLSVVVVETSSGHGDKAFADAFVGRHPGRVWRADASARS